MGIGIDEAVHGIKSALRPFSDPLDIDINTSKNLTNKSNIGETMEIWIAVVMSCQGCNAMAINTFLYKPSQSELEELAGSIGGMYCLKTKVYETQVSEIVKDKLDA